MPRLRRETGPLGAGREFLDGPWTLAASRVMMSPYKEMFHMWALPSAGGLSLQQKYWCVGLVTSRRASPLVMWGRVMPIPRET